jgi:hypothetical protein
MHLQARPYQVVVRRLARTGAPSSMKHRICRTACTGQHAAARWLATNSTQRGVRRSSMSPSRRTCEVKYTLNSCCYVHVACQGPYVRLSDENFCMLSGSVAVESAEPARTKPPSTHLRSYNCCKDYRNDHHFRPTTHCSAHSRV